MQQTGSLTSPRPGGTCRPISSRRLSPGGRNDFAEDSKLGSDCSRRCWPANARPVELGRRFDHDATYGPRTRIPRRLHLRGNDRSIQGGLLPTTSTPMASIVWISCLCSEPTALKILRTRKVSAENATRPCRRARGPIRPRPFGETESWKWSWRRRDRRVGKDSRDF
jgi:hypothetical protein